MGTKYITVGKQVRWHMGHRVWTQDLGHYTKNKCTKLHGHEYVLDIQLSVPISAFDASGMVIDFSVLGRLKKWIDIYLDHRLMLDINDPMLEALLQPVYAYLDDNTTMLIVGIYHIPITQALVFVEQFPSYLSEHSIASHPVHDVKELKTLLSSVRELVKEYPFEILVLLDIPNTRDASLWYPIVNSYVLVGLVPTAENIAQMFKRNLTMLLKHKIDGESIAAANNILEKIPGNTILPWQAQLIEQAIKAAKTVPSGLTINQVTIWETYSAYATC